MVEWNGIFRLFRFSGVLGQPREVHPKFRKEIPENVCSIRSPTRNFRNFWSNGKRPTFPTPRAENSRRNPFHQNFWKFRSKTQWNGSVQPEKFRKNESTIWGGRLFPVGPVGILVQWIAPSYFCPGFSSAHYYYIWLSSNIAHSLHLLIIGDSLVEFVPQCRGLWVRHQAIDQTTLGSLKKKTCRSNLAFCDPKFKCCHHQSLSRRRWPGADPGYWERGGRSLKLV